MSHMTLPRTVKVLLAEDNIINLKVATPALPPLPLNYLHCLRMPEVASDGMPQGLGDGRGVADRG